MAKYISFGQFNKKYFFILGTLIVRIILAFISGFTPYLTPRKPIFIFGFRSNFFSHPMISYCFQYFSLCLGGIILELIFHDKNKNKKKTKENKLEDNKEKFQSKLKYYGRIISVYSLYFFAKVLMNSFDNIGYNRVKYWPLEFIFLFIFAKKIMNQIFYTHQILSISTLMLICTTIYIINSFIPQSNKDCSSLSGDELEDCQILSVNIYNDIIKKLGGHFIPIIILLYLAAMISNAFSAITTKWFMDIKYITLIRMLIYIGGIGLFYSLILLFVFSNVPCSKSRKSFLSYVCKLQYGNDLFYDNYRTLGDIVTNSELYIDIFIIIPIYIVSSFLSIFFELLIIKDLDPFYLIPIDCAYFLIYDIIDYCITFKIANLYRNLKFACQFCSNTIAVFLSSIYFEIIELHFCHLDRHLKRSIIKRVQDEKLRVLNDINESFESDIISIDEFAFKIGSE